MGTKARSNDALRWDQHERIGEFIRGVAASYRAAGWRFEDALPWIEHGIAEDLAAEYVAAGRCSEPDFEFAAKGWRFEFCKIWRAAGWSEDQASQWQESGGRINRVPRSVGTGDGQLTFAEWKQCGMRPSQIYAMEKARRAVAK